MTGLGVPNLDLRSARFLVTSARRYARTVWTKCNTVGIEMPGQRNQPIARLRVPYLHGATSDFCDARRRIDRFLIGFRHAGRGDTFAIRAIGHADDSLYVS